MDDPRGHVVVVGDDSVRVRVPEEPAGLRAALVQAVPCRQAPGLGAGGQGRGGRRPAVPRAAGRTRPKHLSDTSAHAAVTPTRTSCRRRGQPALLSVIYFNDAAPDGGLLLLDAVRAAADKTTTPSLPQNSGRACRAPPRMRPQVTAGGSCVRQSSFRRIQQSEPGRWPPSVAANNKAWACLVYRRAVRRIRRPSRTPASQVRPRATA